MKNKIDSTQPGEQEVAVSIGRSTLYGVVARIAQVATRLVTIPIVIAHLGLGGYGIWAILMTAAAYMRFGSVGIKSAFQKYVAEATGNGNFERTNELLSTGTAAMFCLSVVGLVPISLFSQKLAELSGVPREFLKGAAYSISVLAIIMLLSNVGAAYEAIVMGGHRIDLARRFTTFFTVAEAVAIVILLHLGCGLFAMACTMAVSEVGFVSCCYFASRRVLPQVNLRRRYIRASALPELIRYAGSYQIVNILEVIFNAIIPIALLRVFGADAAGLFALGFRLQNSAQMLSDAVLLPILSGGAKIFGSGSIREMNLVIAKAFKATLALALMPLGFLAAFGTLVVFAWTGETNPALRITLWLLCLSGFFSAFSILGLVLYRISGRALLDNIRQVLRITLLFLIACFAKRLGFYGVLGGVALTEFCGLLFMLYAISQTFQGFRIKVVLNDTWRVTLAAICIFAAGAIAGYVPFPMIPHARIEALVRLGVISLGCLLATWPALMLTKAVTPKERNAFVASFRLGRFRAVPAVAQNGVE